VYQQLWGYKVEEKLYLGVREQKMFEYHWSRQRSGKSYRTRPLKVRRDSWVQMDGYHLHYQRSVLQWLTHRILQGGLGDWGQSAVDKTVDVRRLRSVFKTGRDEAVTDQQD
jgi:hypothetical protein